MIFIKESSIMRSSTFHYKLKTQCNTYKCHAYRYGDTGVAFTFPIVYDLKYYGMRLRKNSKIINTDGWDASCNKRLSDEELKEFNEKYPELPHLIDLFPDINVTRCIGEKDIKLTDSCFIRHLKYFHNTTRDHYAGDDGLLCITGYTEDTVDILNKINKYFNHPTYTWLINDSCMRKYEMYHSIIHARDISTKIDDISGFSKFVDDYTNGVVEFHDYYTDRGTDPIERVPVIEHTIEQPKRITWRWSV